MPKQSTDHPLPVALKTIRLQAFDCHSNTCSWPRRGSTILFNPPFENIPESAFPENAIRSEVPSSRFKLLKSELKQRRNIFVIGPRRIDNNICWGLGILSSSKLPVASIQISGLSHCRKKKQVYDSPTLSNCCNIFEVSKKTEVQNL